MVPVRAMLLRRFQRDGRGRNCVLFTCLVSLLESPVVAQQDVVLTMTSGDQCFGSRVTLLCTHPDPLDDPVKYLPQLIAWAVDGTVLDFSDPSNARFTPTRLSSTSSTLSFTVTEEDHRDRVITCTCFLALNNANRDRDESDVVTIDPPEKPLPPNITTPCSSCPYIVLWTHNKRCFNHHTITYILTWNKTDTPSDPSSSGGANTTESQYDLSGLPPGEYSVSVQAVCNENSAVVSDVVSIQISLPSPAPTSATPSATPTSPQGTCIERLSTGVIAGVVIGSVVVSVMIFIAGGGAGAIAILVYQKTSKQPTKSSVSKEDKVTSSTPGYMNVELEDKSVPMTDNPSYEHVQRTKLTKPLYGNL